MAKDVKSPLICVIGPTAVGKSELAIEICRRIGGEVVSADSMQVYRGMDIGTAKVPIAEQQGVKHHGIDLLSPQDACTVAWWKDQADNAIEGILAKGFIPVICGGTGLYVRAVVDNLTFAEESTDPEIRARWKWVADTYGNDHLHRQLEKVDRVAAERIHVNDVKRVIRALEIAEIKSASTDYDWERKDERFSTLQIGLYMDRQALYRRVETRVDHMIADGLIDEVRQLLSAGVRAEATALQAIGYKEIVEHVQGTVSLDEAVTLIKRNTRRFVKRQLSWFRRDERIIWFQRNEDGTLTQSEHKRLWSLIDEFLEGN